MRKSKKSSKKTSDTILRTRMIDTISEMMKKLSKQAGDDGYAAYLAFCLIGHYIVDSVGAETLDHYVEEIKKKATR